MARSIIYVGVAICAVVGCSTRNDSGVTGKRDWPLRNVGKKPADISVLSGTTFLCGGVPCRLLGVKESANPSVRERAVSFTKDWFKSVGNYIGIYNDSNPLVAEDGTAVVWVRGYDSHLSCLSEELVRAQLVDVDDALWADYTFTVPMKDGDAVEDWRGILRKANEAHEQ
ncbi:MAG TPA: hypothetical protein VKE40_25440 [Gemmataceae bacterium]|nr:hypothetical protein [Gemmataceae bacterium]